MPNELKPCPFCGGDVMLSINYAEQWKVYCTQCERICWIGELRNETSVIEAWNRRVDND